MMKSVLRFSFIIFLIEVVTSEINISENINSDNLTPTYDALMQILKVCKKDYDNILISLDPNQTDLRWLRNFQTELSVVVFQNLTKYDKNHNHTKKIDAFVLIVQSIIDLKRILNNLFKMVWWDVMIPAYILFNNAQKNYCEFSELVLHNIWRYKILTLYFLCLDVNEEIKIYTYNPFTDRAPSQWKRIQQRKEKKHWTLYERKYTEADICQEFDFDRTKYLDGYEVTIACRPKYHESFVTGNFFDHNFFIENPKLFHITVREIIDALIVALKIKYRIYFYHNQQSNKKYYNSLERFKIDVYKNSSADLLLISETLSQTKSSLYLKATYPVNWLELGIVTYNRGYQTPLEKIVNFYGIWIFLFTLFILLTTFFVIWMSENKKLAFATFETIRLLINHTLYTRINTLSLRIFFSMIFIYFLIIHATFHGHLARFLTRPELRKQAETYEDLRVLGYSTLTVETDFADTVTQETKTNNKLIIEACLNHVVEKDTSLACVNSYSKLYKSLHSYENFGRYKNLYINKKPFGSFYRQYIVSRRWPLINRVNAVLLRLFGESGFWKFRFDNKREQYGYSEKVTEARLHKRLRPINLENLTFVFVVLGAGLISATVSFGIEVYISRYLSSIASKLKNIKKSRFVRPFMYYAKKISCIKKY